MKEQRYFPLAVVLTDTEKNYFDEWKKKNNIRTDTEGFLLLLGKYLPLEKEVIKLLSVTHCGNVLEAIEKYKALEAKVKEYKRTNNKKSK